MVTRIDVEMRVYADKARRLQNDDACLFEHFALQSFFNFFATLDATAWKVPAGAVAVANEEYTRRFVDDDALDTERHDILTLL